MSEVTFRSGHTYHVTPLKLPRDLVDRIRQEAKQTKQRYAEVLWDLAYERVCTEPALPVSDLGALDTSGHISWLVSADKPGREDLVRNLRRQGKVTHGLARCIVLAAHEKWGYQPHLQVEVARPWLCIPAGFDLPHALQIRRSSDWLFDTLRKGLRDLDAETVAARMRPLQKPRAVVMPELPADVQALLQETADRLVLSPRLMLLPALLRGLDL
jgi:hypothetical protein